MRSASVASQEILLVWHQSGSVEFPDEECPLDFGTRMPPPRGSRRTRESSDISIFVAYSRRFQAFQGCSCGELGCLARRGNIVVWEYYPHADVEILIQQKQIQHTPGQANQRHAAGLIHVRYCMQLFSVQPTHPLALRNQHGKMNGHTSTKIALPKHVLSLANTYPHEASPNSQNLNTDARHRLMIQRGFDGCYQSKIESNILMNQPHEIEDKGRRPCTWKLRLAALIANRAKNGERPRLAIAVIVYNFRPAGTFECLGLEIPIGGPIIVVNYPHLCLFGCTLPHSPRTAACACGHGILCS